MTRKPELVGFNFLKSDSLYFFPVNLSMSDKSLILNEKKNSFYEVTAL